MTSKRFTVDSDGKWWDIVSHKYVTIDHLFYLVEKLEKENEQLLKEKIDAETKLYKANEQLLMQMDYDNLCKENQDMEFELIKIKKENEQLKKEIFELKYDMDRLRINSKRLRIENEQLKQSNQELNDELQETMGYLALKSGIEKENEQLKQEIETLQEQLVHFDIGDVE